MGQEYHIFLEQNFKVIFQDRISGQREFIFFCSPRPNESCGRWFSKRVYLSSPVTPYLTFSFLITSERLQCFPGPGWGMLTLFWDVRWLPLERWAVNGTWMLLNYMNIWGSMIRMRSCVQNSKWLEKLKLHKVFPGHLKGLGNLPFFFFFNRVDIFTCELGNWIHAYLIHSHITGTLPITVIHFSRHPRMSRVIFLRLSWNSVKTVHPLIRCDWCRSACHHLKYVECQH